MLAKENRPLKELAPHPVSKRDSNDSEQEHYRQARSSICEQICWLNIYTLFGTSASYYAAASTSDWAASVSDREARPLRFDFPVVKCPDVSRSAISWS